EGFAGKRLERGGAVLDRTRRVPVAFEHLAERDAHRALVVDDQDPVHRPLLHAPLQTARPSDRSPQPIRSPRGDAGSVMTKVAPGRLGLSGTVPPCATIAARDTARPSPVPRSLVVKNGAKIASSLPGGTPGPLSAITIRTRAAARSTATRSLPRPAIASPA